VHTTPTKTPSQHPLQPQKHQTWAKSGDCAQAADLEDQRPERAAGVLFPPE